MAATTTEPSPTPRPVSRLGVRRLSVTYLVAESHPSPERIKATLDDAIAARLGQTLSMLLSTWGADANTGVWLIRRLEVDLDVNAAWEPEVLARVVGARIARELAVEVRGGADGGNVLWFPDPEAYLSAFLSDRAGGAASQWYYDSFAGLRSLPVSTALRTAVCDNPARGAIALQRLPPDGLRRVLGAMATGDARRVLEVLAANAPDGDLAHCIDAAWAAWECIPPATLDGDDARDTLRLYLAACDTSGAAGLPLRAAAVSIVRLTRRLASASAGEVARLIAALMGSDMADLYLEAGSADAEAMAPLRSAKPHCLREIVDTLRARTADAAAPPSTTAPGPRYTRFGATFLLLPLLDEMPLQDATADWADLDETPAAAVVRFLLLVKCFGRLHADEAFRDPLLRDLTGVGPEVFGESLASWQTGISARSRRRFLEVLDDWHAARAAITGASRLLVCAEPDGRPVVVFMDAARGIWHFVERFSPGRTNRVLRPIRRIMARDMEPLIVSDPEFIEPLRTACPAAKVVSRADFADRSGGRSALAADGAKADSDMDEALSRLDTLGEDLTYLSLPREWGLSVGMDRALSVAAQGLLRSFAWRLPGFSGAHLTYLRANFLDFAAAMEDEPGRRVVRVGRPPLDLILGLTGMNRATYQIRRLDDRPFTLFPDS